MKGDPLSLGIDAGGSSTRWLLTRGVVEVARGRLGSLSGLSFLGARGEPAAAHDRIEALARAVRSALDDHVGPASEASPRPQAGTKRDTAALAAVVAGVTGLTRGDAAAEAIARALARALDLPQARVRVVDDLVLLHRSAFSPGDGVVVYAGTGSVAVHVTRDGTPVRAGGHGYLIDDAGGGFWIGRRALQVVLRRADALGRPADGELARAIYGALGRRDWPGIRERIYGGGRGEVAALVPAVAAAAAHGDTEAVRIVDEAGVALARLARALMVRLGSPHPVALTGGVTRGLGPALRRALAAALPDDAVLRDDLRDPVEAAARWAAADASGERASSGAGGGSTRPDA